MKMSKKKIYRKSLIYLLISLLTIPLIFAGDVNITVDVIPPPPLCPTEGLSYFLCMTGQGTGNMFSSMGTPMMILIILIALGSAIGYILSSVGKRVEKA